MTAYQPGDLAMATVRGEADVLVLRTARDGWASARRSLPNGYMLHADEYVADVRPMRAVPADAVVIDLGEIDLTLALQAMRDAPRPFGATLGGARSLAALADQIEAQARPPRPDEPLGLGAVVEDAKGYKYVRVAVHFDGWAHPHMWRRVGGEINADPRRAWDAIDSPRVLSEGWSE